MFYKGVLDGVVAEFIDDLPLMLAVDCRWESVTLVSIHAPIPPITAT
jgi:hypothetical protein